MDNKIYRFVRGCFAFLLLLVGWVTWENWKYLMNTGWYDGLSFFSFVANIYLEENYFHIQHITEMRVELIVLAVTLIAFLWFLIRFRRFRKKPEDPGVSGDGSR